MTKLSQSDFVTMYQKIRTAGALWVVTVNGGKVLKAKAHTAMADDLLRKKFETIVGYYDERIKQEQLQDDLESFGVDIV